MTTENRQQNLALELQRAYESLRSARVLLTSALYADSVSRSYYGMLHAARGVLLTEGLEPRTHGGVAHLLNLHFVRTGWLAARLSRHFSRMQADREAADYDRAAVFGEPEAKDVLDVAEEFLEACLGLIRQRGFNPPDWP